MAILNYTTKIAASKTVGEIQTMLTEAGADSILIENQDRQPVALQFVLDTPMGRASFRLPCNAPGVLRALQRDGVEARYRTPEQALRVGWRIVNTWVEAQLAIIDAGQATAPEVFLPYLITPTGETLYRRIETGGLKLLK